jgi:PQQ-dependent catabolism-associated CXXCW motif protein
MRRRAVVALLCGAMLAAAAGDPVPEPHGYRMDTYQAPTPQTLHGASVLSTDDVYKLWNGGAKVWRNGLAVFVDVLPQAPRPAGLPSGTIWHPKPREDIPSSIWLPDTGYGKLPDVMEEYFEQGLLYATDSDPDRLIVFYCRVACWQSWNAAKRALALGYPHVAWYPAGTDGWADAGHPLELQQPMLPRPDETLRQPPAAPEGAHAK